MAPPAPMDFARARPPTPAASWALCVAASAAVACAAVEAGQHLRSMERHSAQATQLAAEIARREQRPSLVARRDAPAQLPERRLTAGRQQVADSLELPWIELLDRIEGASSIHVTLRQLRVEPRFDRAQVDVAAPSLAALFDFERQLGEAGDPIRGSRLAAHEWSGQGAERKLQGRIVLQLRAPAASAVQLPVPKDVAPTRRAVAAWEPAP